MYLEINYNLQQQNVFLPNYICRSNFRDHYHSHSNWLGKAKTRIWYFYHMLFYCRTPGLSERCFSSPDRNFTESGIDNCENVIWWHYSVSESVHLLRHEKERNCVLFWYVLSQDYQRKYKWLTMCSYIKALSVRVPQYCGLWAEAEPKKPLESQWCVAQPAQTIVQASVNANLLWQNCSCSGPVKLKSNCKVESPLHSRIQTFLLLNILWCWDFYSRTFLVSGIFYDSKKD